MPAITTAISPSHPNPVFSPTAISDSENLGQLGNLEVRLAATRAEIHQSQNLRYDIFYQEMSAQPSPAIKRLERDFDEFDDYCDHLLVFDSSINPDKRTGKIIGSYRLLNQMNANNKGNFYSATEFDITPMLDRHHNKNFLEFGRSCVLPAYRNKRTIELLWQGCWAYVRQQQIDVMFGCASFPDSDQASLSHALSFLFHSARAKSPWCVQAQSGLAISMNTIPLENLNARKALSQLPPLVKGYLRLGAMVSQDAVIDPQFNTTDVLIILPVERLNPRYVKYYGNNAERYSPVNNRKS